MLSTLFVLVCLTIMKHCRVQFSLYRDVNTCFFGERKSTSNRKDSYRKSR